MTKEQMIEKLEGIQAGDIVSYDSKQYEVLSNRHFGGKLHRCDISMLEVGKPLVEWVEGKYLAAGKLIQFDCSIYITFYARKGDVSKIEVTGHKEPMDIEAAYTEAEKNKPVIVA